MTGAATRTLRGTSNGCCWTCCLILAISYTFLIEISAATSSPGLLAADLRPMACLMKYVVCGVFISYVKVRSAAHTVGFSPHEQLDWAGRSDEGERQGPMGRAPEKAVMTTGMGVLSLKFLVLSLKDLQKSMRFSPCQRAWVTHRAHAGAGATGAGQRAQGTAGTFWPRAGPTGGAGAALPAGTVKRIKPDIVRPPACIASARGQPQAADAAGIRSRRGNGGLAMRGAAVCVRSTHCFAPSPSLPAPGAHAARKSPRAPHTQQQGSRHRHRRAGRSAQCAHTHGTARTPAAAAAPFFDMIPDARPPPPAAGHPSAPRVRGGPSQRHHGRRPRPPGTHRPGHRVRKPRGDDRGDRCPRAAPRGLHPRSRRCLCGLRGAAPGRRNRLGGRSGGGALDGGVRCVQGRYAQDGGPVYGSR